MKRTRGKPSATDCISSPQSSWLTCWHNKIERIGLIGLPISRAGIRVLFPVRSQERRHGRTHENVRGTGHVYRSLP